MWKPITICALLSLPALAHAQAPTADDWEAMKPERCDPDPQDNLKLTPLIFPPGFKTVQVPYNADRASEVIIFPGHTKENGKRVPAVLAERIIPNMGRPRTRRKFDSQYLGFLDPDGNLVDESGQAITSENPLAHPQADDLPESFELWERRVDPKDPAYADLSGIVLSCQYFLDPSLYETRLKRIRTYERIPDFVCNESGGYTRAPIETNDELKNVRIKIRDARVTIWDHKGRRFSGSAEELADRFNRLAESGTCNWTKAQIE